MNALSEWRPVGLGAAGGAVLLAVLGFTVFGWVSASSAESAAKLEAAEAIVAVLSPICVSQFNADVDAAANLKELQELTSYKQRGYVEEGGWATMPGSEEAMPGVAKSCATMLVAS